MPATASASVSATAIVLGGGAGTRLYPLTKQRAKFICLTPPHFLHSCICLCFFYSHHPGLWRGHASVPPHQAVCNALRSDIALLPAVLHLRLCLSATAIVLGGGAGTRLYPLTKQRAKFINLTPPHFLHSCICLCFCYSHHPGSWRGHASVPPHQAACNALRSDIALLPAVLHLRLCLSATAIILGGGAGTRLYPLTKQRAKPAVPIGGAYRLIDVPMSNCINSGISKIYILTQFNSTSLNRHLARTYNMGSGVRFGGEGFVEVLAATQVRCVSLALICHWEFCDQVQRRYGTCKEQCVLDGLGLLYREGWRVVVWGRGGAGSNAGVVVCGI
jgi:hypothetical protein